MTEVRRPLITGAGGFIGSHLANTLSERYDCDRIYLVDLPGNSRLQSFQDSKRVIRIELNLNSPESLEELPKDVSHVFALAALNGTSRFYRSPFSVLESSSLPTLNVIRKYSSIAPIVYASSSEVYASTIDKFGWRVPTDELVSPSIDSIHNTRWSYATAKLFGEVALVSAAKQMGCTASIVRYHNVYGPDMGFDHFVPDFIQRVRNGEKYIFGADQTRAFLYIDDAVQGTILAASATSEKVPIFHLGSTEELTILQAAKIILAALGETEDNLEIKDAPLGSVHRRCADISLANHILGWSPKWNFKDGIAHLLTY